ncbi:MAG: VWA domain-containing protein, partial [Rhizobiales bacterium]|nr:VWA domain-containing protein [Hyphomicrobiales bacterium]
ALKRRKVKSEPHPLVVLCDVSGSMGEYTRLFLHFMHTLMAVRRKVHVFVFGTRLTNITRQLRDRDVDQALEKVAETVEDWSGGTRIGACLGAFNHGWSRRVLGQGAAVILVSDGLERVTDGVLAAEAARLHRSCARLIWLNPLLRYDGFEPRASGIKTLIGHVDEFRPVHNLQSIAALVTALSEPMRGFPNTAAMEGFG